MVKRSILLLSKAGAEVAAEAASDRAAVAPVRAHALVRAAAEQAVRAKILQTASNTRR